MVMTVKRGEDWGHYFVCDGNHEKWQDESFSLFCSLQMKVGNVIFCHGYKIQNHLIVSAGSKCYAMEPPPWDFQFRLGWLLTLTFNNPTFHNTSEIAPARMSLWVISFGLSTMFLKQTNKKIELVWGMSWILAKMQILVVNYVILLCKVRQILSNSKIQVDHFVRCHGQL